MAKKSIVTLSDEERAQLLALTNKGQVRARNLTRAHILRQADAQASDDRIAAALPSATATVERTRTRCVEEGLEAALHDRPRPGGHRTLEGTQEALRIALACSTPPAPRPCGTMQ